MVETTYREPVSKLLTYGDCNEIDKQIEDPGRDRLIEEIEKGGIDSLSRTKLAELEPIPRVDRWPNYVEELGLSEAHIPELIRLAIDDELNRLAGEDVAVWAPVHAWRSLGQLKAEAAIAPLMNTFLEELYADWAHEEIPWVLGLIGERAIAPVTKYLATRKKKVRGRISASESLERIALQNPDLKDVCLEKLANQLAEYSRNPADLNGFLVSSLIELGSAQYADLISEVYLSKRIDETICGTWPSVQVDLGLAKEEDFDPEELRLPMPEWAKTDRKEADKPSAFELGVAKKRGKQDELSVVYGKGKLNFGKRQRDQSATQKNKGFGKK
ncbi:MAG: hypothetical protein AAFQ63_01350 [Cyanobacteria bacterium J06621_11]